LGDEALEKTTKIEHIIKGWEKKYCYLGLSEQERELFSPVANHTFTLHVLGKELKNRNYSPKYRRIYLGRKIFKDIQVGDVLICYKDSQGNYIIEKKK